MTKDELIKLIKDSEVVESKNTARNSMGCSESFYNAYYMVRKCFTDEELESKTEDQLQDLIKLAEFAGEVFY